MRTLDTLDTLRTRGADRTLRTWGTSRTLRTCCTGRTLRSWRALEIAEIDPPCWVLPRADEIEDVTRRVSHARGTEIMQGLPNHHLIIGCGIPGL